MLDLTKKIPHIQRQRRRANKMVGGTKLCLLQAPYQAEMPGRKAQTKPRVHQDPDTPQKTESDLPWSVCVLRSYGSAVATMGTGALAAIDLGGAAHVLNPLGGCHH